MSYLQFDLDALKRVPDAARAARCSEESLGYGLVRLWQYCWTEKVDTVTDTHISGFFGGDDEIRVSESLVAFKFLERTPSGLRVRGADKYLRITGAQSKAGKANAKNLRRGAETGAEVEPEDTRGGAGTHPGTHPGTQPGPSRESSPALTASSEQRTPNSEHREAAAAAPKVPIRPMPDNPFANGSAFWAFLQHERLAAGLATEKPPRDVDSWFSEMMLELNGDTERIKATVAAFARDKYWKAQNLPTRGLISQWRSFVPQRRASP